jgi:hypothetical protein
MHLSIIPEVTSPLNRETDWSRFCSHRLSMINQHRDSDNSVDGESESILQRGKGLGAESVRHSHLSVRHGSWISGVRHCGVVHSRCGCFPSSHPPPLHWNYGVLHTRQVLSQREAPTC